jgi:beta-galactosidase/beta-glucuronidase
MKKGYESWSIIKGQLMTSWSKEVDYREPLPEYPRPQMKRNNWFNLNGLWDYAIRSKSQNYCDSFDGKILVPFPLESALSGVKKTLTPSKKIWYHRKFSIPSTWIGQKMLLHFGAVDWEASIWVNKQEVGYHKGGFTPFYFEISDYILPSNENELLIAVWDPTDMGDQVHGKQSLKPKIITYTAVSGIWQTVWLEPVPNTYIESLKMIPDIDNETLMLNVIAVNPKPEDKVNLKIFEDDTQVLSKIGNLNQEILVKIESPKLWSPEVPFLYEVIVEIKRNDKVIDTIRSYFGMRKISLGIERNGIKRVLLNNKSLFQYGTLDQGYWPDGLYTAPTDEALKFDIEMTKKLGFNMIRKHVKIEPARWYYYCDKLGILVWQDMPNGGYWSLLNHLVMKFTPRKWFKGKKNEVVKKNYYSELISMINFLFNSPSIIIWVPFNEGWGQFDTENVVETIKNLDSSRLINNASGWFDKGVGDIRDIHNYPDPKMPNRLKGRAAVVGEFGGLGLEVKNHIWKFNKKFVYRNYKNSTELLGKYQKLILKLKTLMKKGLSAAIYTQITDIEHEINGLLTYDRKVIKMDKERIIELNLSLYPFYLKLGK